MEAVSYKKKHLNLDKFNKITFKVSHKKVIDYIKGGKSSQIILTCGYFNKQRLKAYC